MIKSNKNSQKNLYFNFMLTKKRSDILYHIRQYKKSNQIEKYYSDEDGNISFKIKKDDNKKIKVTDIFNKETGRMTAWTVEDLEDFLK